MMEDWLHIDPNQIDAIANTSEFYLFDNILIDQLVISQININGFILAIKMVAIINDAPDIDLDPDSYSYRYSYTSDLEIYMDTYRYRFIGAISSKTFPKEVIKYIRRINIWK